ncbi:MAG: N-acetylmuramoyl-L-alanine amidase [Cocleimonas sp.]|nr:N-acetylmuramoyl-L-alanine amidase [Cocleimonas sp.]
MKMNNSNRKRREFILKLANTLGFLGGVLISPQLLANSSGSAPAHLLSIKLKGKEERNKQQLVFEFDGIVKRSVFSLHTPERVVLDLKNTTLKTKLIRPTGKSSLLQGIRHAIRNDNDLRIVFDLAKKADVSTKLHKTSKGYRLEVTLAGDASVKQSNKKSSTSSRNSATKKASAQKDKKPKLARKENKRRSNHFVVAIDPGHGGKDPGAVGRKGTLEKDVVLKIAHRLKNRINQQGDMKAVLTREGDYYVSLRKRMQKARAEGADLFISIHADANPNRSLTGSSVYILSNRGASSEAARWLARSENSYEAKLGGVTLKRKNKVLSELLLDLSQSATIDNSLGLAENVLKELGGVNRLLRKQVESASFVVLKSPDIPSMLVETAFISNPKEERRLKTSYYQRKLANAMFHGIRRYHLAHKKNSSQFA